MAELGGATTGWHRWRRAVSVGSAVMIGAALAACSGTADSGTPPAGGAGTSGPTQTPAGTGFTDFRVSHPDWLTREHRPGRLTYRMSPPVGGDHNAVWQTCEGNVYTAAVANEHAVHSLEHGAVWVTYRPNLPASQVATLAAKVRGRPYLLMSPYPGLDVAVSLQAWGYQLKVGSATDRRIDDFIASYRIKAAPEPGAPCSGGTTSTP